MEKRSRRSVLKAGMLMGAGLAMNGATRSEAGVGAGPIVGSGTEWDAEYTFGHTTLFMEEYHRGSMEILHRQSGELDHIGDLTSRAARIVKSGGTVWQSMNLGHMPGSEQNSKRRGHPGENVIRDHDPQVPSVLGGRKADNEVLSGYDVLKKGDMLFTNQCNKSVLAARERGVYVVAVTSNYITNEFRPKGFSQPNEGDLMLGDVSNEILHSHVPYNQGLVQAPEIPEFTICPSSTTAQGSMFWMICAELANKLSDSRAKEVDKSAEYLGILTDRIAKIKDTHMPKIRETAVAMARRIRNGGRWFVRSIEHPGFASELTGVASGPMIVNWSNEEKSWDATKEHNVMLITAISPSYPDEMRLAMDNQLWGAFVIGIGPASLDGVVPPGRLTDVSDAGFDNFSPESGGVISIPGRKDTICPTSGIAGNIIQQMICAQWTDEMVRRGSVPFYWMGFFQVGGSEYDTGVRPFFEKQGF